MLLVPGILWTPGACNGPDLPFIANSCIRNACVICQDIDYELPEDDTIMSKHVGV